MRKPYPRGRGPPDKSKKQRGRNVIGPRSKSSNDSIEGGARPIITAREEETQWRPRRRPRVGDVQLIKPAVKQLREVKYFSRFTILHGP